jgi:hypothetical protein
LVFAAKPSCPCALPRWTTRPSPRDGSCSDEQHYRSLLILPSPSGTPWSAGMTRGHSPVLEFIRVNRPAIDMPLFSPCPPRIPILDFVPAVPPARQCRPRGFSPPRRIEPSNSSGFVAPQYRTGFAVFRTHATRIRKPWPSRVVPNSAIHTLRRVPLAGSRTASLRPLPPRRSPSKRAFRRPHSRRGCRSP